MLLSLFVIFRVGEKMRSGKSNAALVGPRTRSDLETYNNVGDKTQTAVTVWDSNQGQGSVLTS